MTELKSYENQQRDLAAMANMIRRKSTSKIEELLEKARRQASDIQNSGLVEIQLYLKQRRSMLCTAEAREKFAKIKGFQVPIFKVQ